MDALNRTTRNLARRLGLRRAIDIAQGREKWHSVWESFGFVRDLSLPFSAPEAKIPITVTRLAREHADTLFDLSVEGMSAEERELRKSRGELFDSGIGTGYVALTDTGEPCYCQWLIPWEQNAEIRLFFKHVFPRLNPGEALLEGAFTPESHRGKGIMPAAMARIAEHGSEIGATRIVTFVTEDNIPSIKGCERAGFRKYTRRTIIWTGLWRRMKFEPLGS
jgi:GNAT superfamily N-acetyltransferase